MPNTRRSSSSTRHRSSWASPNPCRRTTTRRSQRLPARGSTRSPSVHARTRGSPGRGERRHRGDHTSQGGARQDACGNQVTLPKVLRGRAWRFGNNVDTDQIIPAKYAIYSLDEKELGKHAMEGVPGRDTWASQVGQGDILVGGSNFGCGSSREIAPVAIPGAGISLVIADSFARIFFRNAINKGHPILPSPQAAEAVADSDQLQADLPGRGIRKL